MSSTHILQEIFSSWNEEKLCLPRAFEETASTPECSQGESPSIPETLLSTSENSNAIDTYTQRLMTLHSLRQESCGNLFRFSWKSPRMKQGRMTKRRSEKKWAKIVYLYVKQLYLRVVTNYSNLWNFPRKKESIAHLMMIWWCWWLCIKMLHQLKKLKERNSQTLCFSIPSKNATSNPFTLQKTFKLAN